MPQPGLIFRILIASPGDCAQERKIIPEVLAAWNAVNSASTAAVVEPIMWETHSRPEMGDRPQAIINRQLVSQCDALIGAFWTRLGTPTGEAASGTAEEIEQFRAAQKPVLLYFSSAPVVPESLVMEQYQALLRYKSGLGNQGLYSQYESLSDFREQLQRHFAATMIEMLQEHTPPTSAAEVPVPDSDPPDPLAAQREAAATFKREFESFLRRLRAEWNAEKNSDPHSTDDGKYILSRASDEVVHFRSMITSDSTDLSTILDDALKHLRGIQRHRVFMDGGRSFSEFWHIGEQIIQSLEKVPGIIERIDTEGLSGSGT
jgi:hypothetical protein